MGWGAECNLTSSESVDHNHGTTAEWTDPHRNGLGRNRCARWCGSGNRIGQEFFAERHKFTPVTTGQEAVVADPDEAARHNIQQERTQEFIHTKGPGTVPVFVS